MFDPVPSRVSFPDLERETLRFWKEKQIFRRSLEERQGGPLFLLYEGPPTANGTPGVHHVLARVFKDVIPRFKTMQGYYAPRKAGWDTHGLPVELEVERELGLKTKRDIESYGIDKFNQRCRESVFRYVKDWEAMTERIGFWLDMSDPYITFANEYIESCWWALQQLWDKGLLYKGYRVTPHCPRCETSLSDHEVALGYREDTPDPSVFVKLKVQPTEQTLAVLPSLDVPTYFLAWTTTPWTLPANVALAVAPKARYVVVEGTFPPKGQRERFILVEDRLADCLSEPFQVRAAVQGEELVGLQYEPLYRLVEPSKPAWRVVAADFVSTEEGTGVLHIAPAYGAEDLEVGLKEDLPLIHTVGLDGRVMSAPVAFGGKFVKEADPLIMEELRGRGLLYKDRAIRHTYPFCWRCDTPLIYYAKDSWYIRTTAVRDRLIGGNEEINWHPDYIKSGRFGEWLRNNVDWALSRERYWGTPLPIWECRQCGDTQCIGSREELQKKPDISGYEEGLDLHRPAIDRVTFRCEKCQGEMVREPEVLDAWFDSGAMPVAQWHYPFENQETFRARFPADYICEAVDQTRGWFYTLHALSILLFDKPCYRNVICLGLIQDEKGEKMSKSRGNVVDPWSVLNQQGADPMRWYMYTATAPGDPRRFSSSLVGESVRRFFLPLWNVYSFFVTYARLDGFDPRKGGAPPVAERPLLDRWILSRFHGLVQEATDLLEHYSPTDAARQIEAFVEDLSNWYVRRSRRRFWKSEHDADKQAAYHTLYDVLVGLAKLLAPFTPFLAEEFYRNLMPVGDEGVPASVHLARWPSADASLRDPQMEEDIRYAMRLASLGRAARSRAGVKVRQPLARMLVLAPAERERQALGRVQEQIVEEMNVKEIVPVEEEEVFTEYSVRPNAALLGPKYGRDLAQIVRGLTAMNAGEVTRRVRAGRSIEVAGKVLQPEDVLVETRDVEPFLSAREGDMALAIDVTVTADLAQEGLARDLVRHIQELRRQSGLEISDRIVAYVGGDAEVIEAARRLGDYIRQETLAVALHFQEPPPNIPSVVAQIDERTVRLGVQKRE
ncbi:MAG: isoleucine--tRNA ligase [Chloroflexi bacterium]|nr:isoleucine--tRNA ligase [Chloroflexota bacterium]